MQFPTRSAVCGGCCTGWLRIPFQSAPPSLTLLGKVKTHDLTTRQIREWHRMISHVNAGANLHQFAGAIVQRFG